MTSGTAFSVPIGRTDVAGVIVGMGNRWICLRRPEGGITTFHWPWGALIPPPIRSATA